MTYSCHKVECNGKPIHLSCLSCHLSSAEIHVFPHHPRHTLHDYRAAKTLYHSSIIILINNEAGNVPIVYDLSCSTTEIGEIGPLVRPVLPNYKIVSTC